MLLKNLVYADSTFCLKKGNLYIRGDMVFTRKINGFFSDDEEIDCSGLTAIPGFIDIHTHGGGGVDMCTASAGDMDELSKYYASNGVTSFCPTTMTLSKAELVRIFKKVADYRGKEEASYIQGINMEGPYISHEKKGAQNGRYIRKPNCDEFLALRKICPVSLVDIAPETDGAIKFAREMHNYCTVSAAHTASDGKTAENAFQCGFTHVTHMFNAMTGLKAREPGIIAAVLENKHVTVELICDGFHVDPVTIRAMFACLGSERICVVSDSMCSAGCSNGEYMLGGQKVFVKNGRALLADGTIAASVSNIHEEFLNLLDFGIPFSDALKACTINPAKAIGVEEITGSLEDGKFADITLLDGNFDVKTVIAKGKVVFTK